MVVAFSKQIKDGTKESHSAAENTKFVGGFLRGVLDPEEYRKLLTNFWYVYDTMEQRIEESNDPIVNVLKKWSVDLNRTASLEQDLRYFYGPMWREQQIPSQACNTYCYRINEVAEKDPYLLVAHHYTRYIGDLSGGQILKGIAEKALRPPVGEGLNFYDFPKIEDAKAWKDSYRETLDGMGFTEQQKSAIISEANHAFSLNMYLFDEIHGNAFKGFFKVIVGLLGGK
tara:strand:- start:813 stop:1496 length:684 start_codon:yes stop_codon:yes gene_type:complete